MIRLTTAMPIQQHMPTKIGLPPLFTSLTILVLRPMAAIAITMKNLLRVFNGINTSFGMPADTHMVVMMEAATKKSIKNGKIFVMRTL